MKEAASTFVRSSSFAKAWISGLLVLAVSARAEENGGLTSSNRDGVMWMVGPLAGVNRDVLKRRGREGTIQRETTAAPEYGLFALVAHPRFVANDFLFFTEAANANVIGNMLSVNLYGNPAARTTWNIGVGHLYHNIESENNDIVAHVPLAKAGPLLRWRPGGITFNPYVGYAWERVETTRATSDDEAYLYGITVDWRWRMLGINAKYYYQDNRDGDEDFNNVHLRIIACVNPHWGVMLRLDHMEHVANEDTSALMGLIYFFNPLEAKKRAVGRDP